MGQTTDATDCVSGAHGAQRVAHGEVPAYNNAALLYCQARFWELDGTVMRPTPSPSGHLGEGLL